jgi:hypothetical protein
MSDVILEEACLQTSVVVGKRVTLGWAYGQSDWAYGHTNGKDILFCIGPSTRLRTSYC